MDANKLQPTLFKFNQSIRQLNFYFCYEKLGLRLEKRIEEAVPAGQQLQELGMRLRCDDSGSENVSVYIPIVIIPCSKNTENFVFRFEIFTQA